MLIQLVKNCEFWFSEWKKYKDTGSFRNAVFAAGKVAGFYSVLDSLDYKIDEEQKARMKQIHDELMEESANYKMEKYEP